MSERRQVGARAETLAAEYLSRHGLKILHRNLRLGRLGELDIVANDRGALVFVEVKARFAGGIGGLEHINEAKIRKLADLAATYLQRNPGKHTAIRFDAFEVVFKDRDLRLADLHYIPDAFRL